MKKTKSIKSSRITVTLSFKRSTPNRMRIMLQKSIPIIVAMATKANKIKYYA